MCATLCVLGFTACSDAEPTRTPETPGTESTVPPLEGIGSLASWSAISRGATPSELLIFPAQLTTDPNSECFNRYTARVQSRTADRLTVALVRQSERPRDFACVGAALTGPPVTVALDAPYAGEELVDAASGRVEMLAPRSTYETPPTMPPATEPAGTDHAKDLGFRTSPPGFETGPPQ